MKPEEFLRDYSYEIYDANEQNKRISMLLFSIAELLEYQRRWPGCQKVADLLQELDDISLGLK